jgi:uncharacterized FlaG/YvyC family protein
MPICGCLTSRGTRGQRKVTKSGQKCGSHKNKCSRAKKSTKKHSAKKEISLYSVSESQIKKWARMSEEEIKKLMKKLDSHTGRRLLIEHLEYVNSRKS